MYLTEKQIANYEKKNGIIFCRFCGKACSYADSEYSYTRRKELIAIHRKCYNYHYFGTGGPNNGE